MRRRRSRVAVVAFAATLTLAPGCGDNPTETLNDEPSGPNDDTVELKNNAFIPPKIEVSEGDTVTWEWKESVGHNVVFEDGEKSEITPEGPYERTFDKAGAYPYECTLHPGMTGQVVVS
jgi:plastocyanin